MVWYKLEGSLTCGQKSGDLEMSYQDLGLSGTEKETEGQRKRAHQERQER